MSATVSNQQQFHSPRIATQYDYNRSLIALQQHIYPHVTYRTPILVATWSNASVRCRSLAETRGSCPAGGTYVLSVVRVVCCEVEVSTHRRDFIQRSPSECSLSACVTVNIYTYHNQVEEVQMRKKAKSQRKHKIQPPEFKVKIINHQAMKTYGVGEEQLQII